MGPDPSDLSSILRGLRRYATAALDSRVLGDRVVEAALVDLLAETAGRPALRPLLRSSPRLRLYRAVQDRLALMPGGGGGRLAELLPRDRPAGGEPRADAVALARHWLRRRLRRLTPAQRHALLLHHLEGFGEGQIGGILRLRRGAVRALLAEAWAIAAPPGAAEVLIIEDEMLTALDISMVMHDLGHHVLGIASTAREAELLLEEGRPDLILSDLRLAAGSGASVLRRLRAEDAVPVVYVTGSPDPLCLPLRPGPFFVIRKPFNLRHLVMTVCDALAAGRERRLALP